jgi:RHS repeat-associated protein
MKMKQIMMMTVLLLTISLAGEAQAFYNQSTGRWLSRDPITDEQGLNPAEELGGPNLYGFVGNDPLQNTDPFGFKWTVIRSGGSTALAVCECGDTVAGLADLVKLDAEQYRAWLKTAGTTSLPGSENDPLTYGTFLVPNTAYIDVSTYNWGFLGDANVAMVYHLRSVFTRRGYDVVYTGPRRTTKSSILHHLALDDIYTFVYVGHGSAGSLTAISDPTGQGITQGIITRDRYTHYGIALMWLIACEGNDGANPWWKENVSRAGTLITAHGDISAWSGWNWVVDHGD